MVDLCWFLVFSVWGFGFGVFVGFFNWGFGGFCFGGCFFGFFFCFVLFLRGRFKKYAKSC